MEEGTRGAVTAESPSNLGLEKHLVIGLLVDVLLKYFSPFQFIENKTPKTCYYSAQRRMHLQYCKMQSEGPPLSFCISCGGPLASPKKP